jgi:hypothetical protein
MNGVLEEHSNTYNTLTGRDVLKIKGNKKYHIGEKVSVEHITKSATLLNPIVDNETLQGRFPDGKFHKTTVWKRERKEGVVVGCREAGIRGTDYSTKYISNNGNIVGKIIKTPHKYVVTVLVPQLLKQ